jgi:hypothetical protein
MKRVLDTPDAVNAVAVTSAGWFGDMAMVLLLLLLLLWFGGGWYCEWVRRIPSIPLLSETLRRASCVNGLGTKGGPTDKTEPPPLDPLTET